MSNEFESKKSEVENTGQKQNFFQKMFKKLDKKMTEKAEKSESCCCGCGGEKEESEKTE